MSAVTTEGIITLNYPTVDDGFPMWDLVRRSPPLDLNSVYSYLMCCRFFAGSSVVAREGEKVVGFVTAFQSADRPHVLFIWQVAVEKSQRGKGLAIRMLEEILSRGQTRKTAYLETTVSPSNQASQSLFHSLASKLGARLEKSTLFQREDFGDVSHEEEILFRIGPIRGEGLTQGGRENADI